MTLAIAWIRKVLDTEELVVATDSRLRSGYAWDCCPKIITLPRNDSVICFAGDTMYAYPIMFQIRNAVEMNLKLRSRALDICDARGHFLRMITKMQTSFHDFPVNRDKVEDPDTLFIFAGYSWAENEFKIWIFGYNKQQGKYIHSTPTTIMKNLIAVVGDDAKEIRKKIYDRLKDNGKKPGDGMDMEPFEVLREKIRENSNQHIGGPPQIAKVYKHLNVMPYGVFWPNKESKEIAFLGRPILNYELVPYPIIDPDTMQFETLKVDNPEYPRVSDNGERRK